MAMANAFTNAAQLPVWNSINLFLQIAHVWRPRDVGFHQAKSQLPRVSAEGPLPTQPVRPQPSSLTPLSLTRKLGFANHLRLPHVVQSPPTGICPSGLERCLPRDLCLLPFFFKKKPPCATSIDYERLSSLIGSMQIITSIWSKKCYAQLLLTLRGYPTWWKIYLL